MAWDMGMSDKTPDTLPPPAELRCMIELNHAMNGHINKLIRKQMNAVVAWFSVKYGEYADE